MARVNHTRTWSWEVAQIAGIRIFVHGTFLLLVGWFAIAYWLQVGSLARVASGVALFLLLFAGVLLHELGHAQILPP
jgi:Zn-dependent protease